MTVELLSLLFLSLFLFLLLGTFSILLITFIDNEFDIYDLDGREKFNQLKAKTPVKNFECPFCKRKKILYFNFDDYTEKRWQCYDCMCWEKFGCFTKKAKQWCNQYRINKKIKYKTISYKKSKYRNLFGYGFECNLTLKQKKKLIKKNTLKFKEVIENVAK